MGLPRDMSLLAIMLVGLGCSWLCQCLITIFPRIDARPCPFALGKQKGAASLRVIMDSLPNSDNA